MAAGHKIGVEFDELWKAYPISGQRDLVKSLGGNVPEVEGSGSATRLSAALNKVGWDMPSSEPFTGKEYKDKDGHFVAVHVHALESIFNRRFGKPSHCKDGRKSIAGKKKGIILFKGDADRKIHGDTGFITLWNGSETPQAEEYFDEAENKSDSIEAYIWEMKE